MWGLLMKILKVISCSIFLCLIFSLAYAGDTHISTWTRRGLTGGGIALDGISGLTISPNDVAITMDISGNTVYVHIAVDTGVTTENAPFTITPDTLQTLGDDATGGTTTWELAAVSGNTGFFQMLVLGTVTLTPANLATLIDGSNADSLHAHASAGISGVDISADTNLTAGNFITLTDDDLNVDDMNDDVPEVGDFGAAVALNAQGNIIASGVTPLHLANTDFGDWTCSSGDCTLDANVVDASNLDAKYALDSYLAAGGIDLSGATVTNTLPVSKGGTGNTASGTSNSPVFSNGSNFIPVNPASGRDALGVVIGTDVQAQDAELDTIAALTETSGNVMVAVANAWASVPQPVIDCTNCTGVELTDADIARVDVNRAWTASQDFSGVSTSANTPTDNSQVATKKYHDDNDATGSGAPGGDANSIQMNLAGAFGGASIFQVNNRINFEDPAGASGTTVVTIDTAGIHTTLNFVSTGTISGGIGMFLETGASVTVTEAGARGGMYINNDNDIQEIDLPPAVAGMSLCYYSLYAKDIELDPDASDSIVLDGAITPDVGDRIRSAGAAGDFVCVAAISGVSWITLGRSGTWTDAN